MTRFRIALFALIALVPLIVLAEDPVAVAPAQFKVVLENDEVRVLEFSAKTGETTPMHSHPGHVIYPLADGKTRFTYPDGTTREIEVRKGVSQWIPPATHAHVALTDNLVLVIEVKPHQTASTSPR